MQIPDILDVSDEDIMFNTDMIAKLEETIMSLEIHIMQVIKECLEKVTCHRQFEYRVRTGNIYFRDLSEKDRFLSMTTGHIASVL